MQQNITNHAESNIAVKRLCSKKTQKVLIIAQAELQQLHEHDNKFRKVEGPFEILDSENVLLKRKV